MKHALVIALALAAGTSHAAYRCTAASGAVSYQDAPCAAGERAVALEVLAPRVSVAGPAWAPHVPVAAPAVAQTTVVTTVVVVKQGGGHRERRREYRPSFGGY